MMMLDLFKYDVPMDMITLWRERESDHLLPLQELAVKKHGLFGKENLLIQAPTSSGKTFIGEMAALQTAMRRKKVVYLVPLKALAEEKYADFKDKYAQYGIDVIISTRDYREFDAKLEDGNFSIAIVVYEKLEQLLVRRPERLQEIELVIADEVELLSDPERGAEVELLLTHLLRSGCRMIGLSAVLGEADKLADWMRAGLVTFDQRPTELRYGVLHEGTFHYRTYNDFGESQEDMVEVHSDSSWEIITENTCALVERDETCLIFVKAKHETRHGAEILAHRITASAATHAIDKLKTLEPTHSRDCLLNTLNHGVAFHNADLSPDERRIVEDAFRNGEVRVMVSTSTLAKGMNLPAQNVFLTTDKWQYDARFGMPWKSPILRSEYENMGGRAGRYGAPSPFGRSILVAPTAFDYETYWRRYVEGERETIQPRLAKGPLEDHLLRLVAARTCVTEAELFNFMSDTLTGRWIWAETLTIDEVELRVRAALNRAADNGMLTKHPDGRVEPTPFGQAVAAKGIAMATALELEHWLHESEHRDWAPIDLLLAAAQTADGRLAQVMLTSREYEHAAYLNQLKQRTRDCESQADVPMNRLRNATVMPFFEEVRAIKAALFLDEWIDHRALYDLEDAYHTMAGQVLSAADQMSWLIDAAATLAQAFGCEDAFVERLTRLAARVKFGVRDEALTIARQRAVPLDRNTLLALSAAELTTPNAIASVSVSTLKQWLDREAAEQLHAWALKRAAKPAEHDPCDAPSTAPVLILDDAHPNQITLDETTIKLQEKQYRLIELLAQYPNECVSYEHIYQHIWGDAVVENNQMHFQKKKLLAAIKKACPHRADIIKTIPKRGFTLTLTPAEVTQRKRKTAA